MKNVDTPPILAYFLSKEQTPPNPSEIPRDPPNWLSFIYALTKIGKNGLYTPPNNVYSPPSSDMNQMQTFHAPQNLPLFTFTKQSIICMYNTLRI